MTIKNVLRKACIFLSLIAMWTYLSWRVVYTIPSGFAYFAGIILFLVELVQIIQNTIYYIILYKPVKYKVPELPNDLPTVDILIATYNESTDILQRTILACKNVIYDENKVEIWLCDDGRRKDVQKLASHLSINYLDRTDNSHAKAGNLNNALKKTKGELIVTLDADMLPKPTFLQKTVGFFIDDNVGFVQTPQSFYNEDLFQYNSYQSKKIPNEQDMFMQEIQSGRDRYNAAIYVGSNTIFNRKALEAIGGFATGTITEDMATGMLMQAKGYKTIAYSEVLAQGLASESLSDLIKQRVRWARGTIQTMRIWNPLSIKGLSIMQRILYTSSAVYWYFGVFKMVFILAPMIYLLLGVPFLNASLEGILAFWLPYFLLTNLTSSLISNKKQSFFWNNLHETLMAPSLAWGALVETFLKKPIKFNVTPKGVQSNKASLSIGLIKPVIVLTILSVLATIKGSWDLYNSSENTSGLLINLFWSIFNLIMLLSSLMIAYERPRYRTSQRFKREYNVNVKSGLSQIKAKSIDISDNGCSIGFESLENLNSEVELIIYGNERHKFKAKLVYYDYDKILNCYRASFQFNETSLEQMQKWVLEIYGVETHEEEFQYDKKTGFFSVIVKYIRSYRKKPMERKRTSPRVNVKLDCKIYSVGREVMEETAATTNYNKGVVLSNDIPYCEGEVIDLSMNGCKLVLKNMKEIPYNNDLVINIPNLQLNVTGKIIQTYKRGKLLTVGVKFVHQIENHYLRSS